MTRKRIFVSDMSADTDLAAALKTLLEEHFSGALEVSVSSDRETLRADEKWLADWQPVVRGIPLQNK